MGLERIGNILFVIAGLMWGIELIPQLIKTFKTKSIGDFSPFFLTLCLIAYIIFMTGCVLIKNWFLFFSHIIPSINVIILCILYRLYKNKKIEPCDNPNGDSICNKGYACDACPCNKEIK